MQFHPFQSAKTSWIFFIQRFFIISAVVSALGFLLELVLPGFIIYTIPLIWLLMPFILATLGLMLIQ
ncbi:MAG: hypothetical protein H6760_02265 [Candidatus Nomurabacteria bacterium]|nr:MAG: hypothetical protein H6760_02265 [Candidatus Nomurabacteria bacterium]